MAQILFKHPNFDFDNKNSVIESPAPSKRSSGFFSFHSLFTFPINNAQNSPFVKLCLFQNVHCYNVEAGLMYYRFIEKTISNPHLRFHFHSEPPLRLCILIVCFCLHLLRQCVNKK